MANALYALGKQKLLEGIVDWLGDDIKVVLVDSALYTPNLTTDEFLDDIPVGARVATSPNLASKTTDQPAPGVADADNVTLSSVSGSEFEYIVVYQDTGVEATSALLVLFDTAAGLPFTPSGSDIVVVWDSGANRIFAL